MFAKVEPKVKLLKSIFIKGLKHSVTYVGKNKISIGCETYTIKEWKKMYNETGKENGYEPDEVKEYGIYIDLIEKFSKIKQ